MLQVEDIFEEKLWCPLKLKSNYEDLETWLKFQNSETFTSEELKENGRRWNWSNRYKISVYNPFIPYLYISILVSLLLENSFKSFEIPNS